MDILYKKTGTGAIQSWTIRADGNVIVTTYGLVCSNGLPYNGSSLQTTCDTIDVGKNIGRSNETTPAEQAAQEAQSKFEKQLKKGYVRTIAEAQAGKVDKVIEGGVVPMLAKKFSEDGHKITYPAYCQPKLDGIRCVAIIKDGVCTLWSRTRKPITAVPHIIRELERLFPKGDHTFDGELYNHKFKKDFEKIIHLVRQEAPGEGHEVVQYHIYDMVSAGSFSARTDSIRKLFAQSRNPIVLVSTVVVKDEDELMERFDEFVAQGYEGAMVRNSSSPYVNKRSYDLQKIKEFLDDEFQIVGIEEGRGKLQGHAATFICKTKTGETFKAKMKGDTGLLKKYFEDYSLWQNRHLQVKYQGLTRYGIPRFPVGIRFRDDKGM